MKTQAINCTSCAAPLKINGGGHRIRTLNCNYCGAVMDVQEKYSLLGKFLNQNKPDSPLQIGTEGKIKDISFIIIGMIGYRSNYGDSWVDLFLYSETHGYAYLTYSLGHFTFTRRVRYLPDKDITHLGRHSTFHVDKRQYTFFEAYIAEVTYVAGELTWVTKPGDKNMVRDSVAPPFMFTQEVRENETEYYLGEYIEPELIHDNFKTTYDTHRSFNHLIQPFAAPIKKGLSKASKFALIASIIMLVLASLFGNGKKIYHDILSAEDLSQGALSRDFTINNPKHLIELQYKADLSNAWTSYDITLFKDEFEVFSFNRQLSYYSGSDADGRWTEGKQTGTARFKVKEAGNYSLRVHASEGGEGEYGADLQHNPLTIKIKEGIVGKRYLFILFFISLLSYSWYYLSRYFFEKKRWGADDDD